MPIAWSQSANALITNAAGTALCENCCPDGVCPCCTAISGISDTVYVRLINVLNFVNPCGATCIQAGNLCYDLTKTGSCTWTGTGLVNATCIPISALTLTLTCNATTVTMTLTWQLSATDTAIFQKVIPGSTLNCNDCTVYDLDPIDNATTCDTAGTVPEVSFKRSAKCCQYCPDSYLLHFQGFTFSDGSGKCSDAACNFFFGNAQYVVDRVQTYTNPPDVVCGVAHDGGWCKYSRPFDFRCPDTRYGFCELSLFIRTNSDCKIDALIYVKYDDNATTNCVAPTYQAWRKLNLDPAIVGECETLSLDFTFADVCVDTNWNCDSQAGHIELQAL